MERHGCRRRAQFHGRRGERLLPQAILANRPGRAQRRRPRRTRRLAHSVGGTTMATSSAAMPTGKRRIIGGTSASSPSFAGIVTLLNQYLVKQHVLSKAGLGNIRSHAVSHGPECVRCFPRCDCRQQHCPLRERDSGLREWFLRLLRGPWVRPGYRIGLGRRRSAGHPLAHAGRWRRNGCGDRKPGELYSGRRHRADRHRPFLQRFGHAQWLGFVCCRRHFAWRCDASGRKRNGDSQHHCIWQPATRRVRHDHGRLRRQFQPERRLRIGNCERHSAGGGGRDRAFLLAQPGL